MPELASDVTTTKAITGESWRGLWNCRYTNGEVVRFVSPNFRLICVMVTWRYNQREGWALLLAS